MITKAAICKNKVIYIGNNGQRHHHIMRSYPSVSFKGPDCIQGFMTNKGEFLNREQAAEHAHNCGQINNKPKRLFSEDLW